MSRPVFPIHAVSALFLERQHLRRPREQRLTPGRLVRFVEDVGGLQLDSINVVDRAHYLTVWSRFGPYERAHLDRLVYRRRLLFEYWAHAACLVPRSTLPFWKRAMLEYEIRHTGWSSWLRKNTKVLQKVTESIRANGPMRNADFQGRRPAGAPSGWWSWGPVQHAVHYLWMTGVLAVDARLHFQKRFDLVERALPETPGVVAVSTEAFQRWHLERSLHAMGAATEADLRGYLTYPRTGAAARRATLRAMLDAGEIMEIDVERARERWFALTRDLGALARASRRSAAAHGTTLLSPFDSFLWYRDRIARLFGFDYRIEVYTPGHKRVHGYYSLPILHHGHLIGRFDAKAHRRERRLEVRNVHFERWVSSGDPPPVIGGGALDTDEVLAGLAGATRALATFLGADQITVGRVTPRRMRSPLARALRETSEHAARPPADQL